MRIWGVISRKTYCYLLCSITPLVLFIFGTSLLSAGLFKLSNANVPIYVSQHAFNDGILRFGFEGGPLILTQDGRLITSDGRVVSTNAENLRYGKRPFSFSQANFDDSLIRNSVGNIFKLIEGAFGALIMVVAGLMAIVAAAMGSYKSALAMLVVAVGAFILRSLVSLFFGSDFTDYDSQVKTVPQS